jgi:glucans biosynthesis protein C
MQVTEAGAPTAVGTGGGPVPHARAAELDWLRLGAVIVVLVVHAAQIFSPFESWHIESPDRSWLLGLLTAFAAPWIMPLFMLLAGAGAWYSLQRRTPLNWFRARALRLVLPLVLGTLILIPPQVYFRRIYRGEFDGTLLEFYTRFFDGVFPEGNFSYGHLWFILYLFLYFVAALPLFQLLRGSRGAAMIGRVAALCSGRMGILWLAVPIAAGQLLFRATYTQSTGTVINDWATHAWLFTALMTGYALAADPRLMDAVDRAWRATVWPAFIAWVALGVFVLQGDPYNRVPAEPGAWYVVFWSTFSFASWAWMVVILGAARAHLSRSTPFLERWRGTAYGIYVLHQTVVVAVAYYVVGWPVDVHLRFIVVAVASLALTVLLIGLLKRVPGTRAAFGIG